MYADIRRQDEQKRLLRELQNTLCNDAQGLSILEANITKRAYHLLNAIVQRNARTTKRFVIGDDAVTRVISQIEKFSRTPEEVEHLLKRLLIRLIDQGFYSLQMKYAIQARQQASPLYEGGNPSDEVPDLED